MSDSQTVKTWIGNKERGKLKFADNPAKYDYYQKIVTDDTLVEWQTKLNKIVPILKKSFKANLPLNFHFVENDTHDWMFLNIRKGFNILKPNVAQIESHIVGSTLDVEKWDGIKQKI
jgi:hypothetical protein